MKIVRSSQQKSMTKRLSVLLFASLAWTTFCSASEQETLQWIVVTPPAYREALKPLIDHRTAEGLKVVVVETTQILTAEQIKEGNAELLKKHLRQLSEDFKGSTSILLVGTALTSGPTAEKTAVPALRGTVGRMKNRPSDQGYGCLGTELMPKIAVGRFPARNAEEARQMAAKTLKQDENCQYEEWQNRLVILMGNPGGNTWLEKKLVDAYVQSAATDRLARLHPSWEVRSIIHCSTSPFCLPNEALQDGTMKYLQEGQFFSFYLGHSGAGGLWSDGVFFMGRDAWAKLKIPQGKGVFFTCGCFSCQQSGMDGEGYGLVAIRNPDGPTAVIGAYAESYAAMGQLALDGMLKRFSSAPKSARLADYWLEAQAGLDHGAIDAVTFRLLDQADGSRGKTPLEVQRLEHLEMWTLLGDPALRLPVQEANIQLVTPESAEPGKRIVVKGTLPDRLAGVTVHVALQRPIGSPPNDIAALPGKQTEKHARIMAENHRRANNVVLAKQEVKPSGTGFECEMELPGKISSENLIIHASASTDKNSAYGIAVLSLKKSEMKN